MPVVTLTSKGQMTIPKEIREALNLKPTENVIIVVEGDHAIIKPLRGNILDIGGAVRIADKEKPIDFHKIRAAVKKRIAKKRRTVIELQSERVLEFGRHRRLTTDTR